MFKDVTKKTVQHNLSQASTDDTLSQIYLKTPGSSKVKGKNNSKGKKKSAYSQNKSASTCLSKMVDYPKAIVIGVLIVYSAFVAQNLPVEFMRIFNNIFVRILLSAGVIYATVQDVSIGIMSALALIVSMQVASQYDKTPIILNHNSRHASSVQPHDPNEKGYSRNHVEQFLAEPNTVGRDFYKKEEGEDGEDPKKHEKKNLHRRMSPELEEEMHDLNKHRNHKRFLQEEDPLHQEHHGHYTEELKGEDDGGEDHIEGFEGF